MAFIIIIVVIPVALVDRKPYYLTRLILPEILIGIVETKICPEEVKIFIPVEIVVTKEKVLIIMIKIVEARLVN
jgi:hypothetical protein